MSALANSGVVAALIKGVSWVAGVLGLSLDEMLLLISLLVGMWLFLIRARMQMAMLRMRKPQGSSPIPQLLQGPAVVQPPAVVDVVDVDPDLADMADLDTLTSDDTLADAPDPPRVRQVSAVANGGWAGRGASLDDLRLA
jgi:hypothetical protein